MSAWHVVQFLKDWSVPYSGPDGKKVMPGWVGISCPFCGKGDWSGGFLLSDARFNCWGCGGHSVASAVARLTGMSYRQAETTLEEYSGSGDLLAILNQKKAPVPGVRSVSLPGTELRRPHRTYLEGRGFDPDYLVRKYGLRGTLAHDDYPYRIIIPIVNGSGKVIAYQGRDITGKSPLRYKGSRIAESVVHYKTTLYGLDHAQGDSVGVVEGIFDAWALGDGFLATFGTAVTPEQVKALSRFRRVFILFDPEEEAQKKARKLAERLELLGREVEIVGWGSEKDPGEFTPEEARAVRKALGFRESAP